MEGRELTVSGEMAIEIPCNPVAVLAGATQAAKALKDVVANKPKPVVINGEQYLENEDWQTCGQFYGYTTKTHDAIPIEVEGVKGAKAYADLVDFRSGLVVGGAEAYCMRDEDKWKNKPWYQLASMAQTRASSKAFKNRLSWVVVLAGYKTTPAEEMTGTESQANIPADHYCQVHKTKFFKSKNMKGYAHPIGDTGEWCNEPSDNQKPAIETPTTPTSTSEKQQPASPKTESSSQQPSIALPASHSEVQRKLNHLIHENIWTIERAIKEMTDRGGVGKDSLEKIKSLKPDKLQELNKAIEEAKGEKAKELFN